MSTALDLKNLVANQLGSDTGVNAVPKRDRLINAARKTYYLAHRWSFLRTQATITLTSQAGPMPTDWNKKFEPEIVFHYSGTTQYKYTKVPFDQIDAFQSIYYVYGINRATKQIKTNQPTITAVLVSYYSLPADIPLDQSQDSAEEPAPDISTMADYAIARWWLASERDEAAFDRFYKMVYLPKLQQDMKDDASNDSIRPYRPLRANLGYNRGFQSYDQRGYIPNVF